MGLIFRVLMACAILRFAAGQKCGRPRSSARLTGKIVGGYDVGYYKYPWFVALLLDEEPWCGGTLISPKIVVTAAHCYRDYLGQKGAVLEDVYTYKLGIYKSCQKEPTQREFRAAKVQVHEEYLKKQPYYDIALITLAKNADGFEPACLPPRALEDDTRGREGIIIGLGTTKYAADSYPCNLHEGRVLLFPDKTCKSMIMNATSDKEDYAIKDAFCAGYMEGGVDACQGDSGGPLLIQLANAYYILGLTSFGYDCAKPNLLGIYTDVSHYLGWIEAKSGVRSDLEATTAIPITTIAVKEILTPIAEVAQTTVPPIAVIPQAISPVIQPIQTIDDNPYTENTVISLGSKNNSIKCGVPNVSRTSFRIINGRPTKSHIYPWVAYLKKRNTPYCGATIINDLSNTRYLTVCVGSNDIEGRTIECIGVNKIFVHERFTPHLDYDDNDLALLKLYRRLVFNENIKPACLPVDANNTYANEQSLITGWGKTENATQTRYLRYSHVKVLKDEDCKKAKLIGGRFSVGSNICAYGHGTDSCSGDSGSGLMYARKPSIFDIIGIVSWGAGCGLMDVPGVYVRVNQFLPWIMQNTEDAYYCNPQ